jgi:hypothetical protein
MILTKSTRFLIVAAAFCSVATASDVFNFDSDSLGTSTTFTDTVNGLSATFSSTADPGGFVVYGSIFDALTGNVLGDPGPASTNGVDLSIALSNNLSAIALNFATADFGAASPLTITAYENTTEVGSATATGTVPGGFTFPEGEVALSGKTFNNIVVSSSAPDFAVDDISATVAPEPAVCGLLGLGLLALGSPAVYRKSRRAATAK